MEKNIIKTNENELRKIVKESVQSVLADYERRESDDQESLKSSVVDELRMFLYQMISGESFNFQNRDNSATITTKLYWTTKELQILKQIYSTVEKLAQKLTQNVINK